MCSTPHSVQRQSQTKFLHHHQYHRPYSVIYPPLHSSLTKYARLPNPPFRSALLPLSPMHPPLCFFLTKFARLPYPFLHLAPLLLGLPRQAPSPMVIVWRIVQRPPILTKFARLPYPSLHLAPLLLGLPR